MFNGSLFYGRRGIVLNVISGIDLALWDLLGQVRQEPVGHPLGGKVPDELVCYATGPRPDLAKEMGFIGGKLPPRRAPCDGDVGLAATIADLATMRDKVGPDFRLPRDSWMSLDVGYAERLALEGASLGLKWIEKPLPPDDYWVYADLRRKLGGTT